MNTQDENNLLIETENSCYRLTQEILGVGAFGQVQVGINLLDRSKVAVKVIPTCNARQALQQIKILKLLNQFKQDNSQWNRQKERQNTLKFFTYHWSYNWFYVVTECFGSPLSTIIPTIKQLDFFFALQTFKSIIQSVKPLRLQGILHRDIKPANILLKYCAKDKIYKAKLCDFGLSVVEIDSKNSLTDYQRVGTLVYQSPEVIKFKEYSQKSQIWSLGLVFYELIYKKLPFSISQIVSKDSFYEELLTKPIKFQQIPSDLAEIGKRCLAINQKKRLTFDDLQQKVNEVYSNLFNIERKKLQFEIESKNNFNGNEKQDGYNSCRSNISTIELSVNKSDQKSRKASQQISEIVSEDREKEQILRMFRIVKQRYLKMKRTTKILSPIHQMLQNITDQNRNKQCEIVSLDILNILEQNLKKMKIVCEFSENQKQIAFNINQFMFADSLLIITNVIKHKLHKQQSRAEICLRDYLEHGSQTKPMQYYKQLRKKVLAYE